MQIDDSYHRVGKSDWNSLLSFSCERRDFIFFARRRPAVLSLVFLARKFRLADGRATMLLHCFSVGSC